MREVSCRIFPFLSRGLLSKGIAPEAMVEGTSVALATLQDKHERIDWPDFCAVMRNVRKHFSDAEFLEGAWMAGQYIGFGRVLAMLQLQVASGPI